jgi:hypothetical protein
MLIVLIGVLNSLKNNVLCQSNHEKSLFETLY